MREEVYCRRGRSGGRWARYIYANIMQFPAAGDLRRSGTVAAFAWRAELLGDQRLACRDLLEVERVLRQTRADKADCRIARPAQHGPVRHPNQPGRAGEEAFVHRTCERLVGGAQERPGSPRALRTQSPQQLRKEADVGQLVRDECSAQDSQSLTAGN